MATRGQLGSNAIEVTLRVHLVFLGKERRPTFGGSRAFLLDTPTPPRPAPKGASSSVGPWPSPYTPCSGGGCQDPRVQSPDLFRPQRRPVLPRGSAQPGFTSLATNTPKPCELGARPSQLRTRVPQATSERRAWRVPASRFARGKRAGPRRAPA